MEKAAEKRQQSEHNDYSMGKTVHVCRRIYRRFDETTIKMTCLAIARKLNKTAFPETQIRYTMYMHFIFAGQQIVCNMYDIPNRIEPNECIGKH